jgi:hypothetical protein
MNANPSTFNVVVARRAMSTLSDRLTIELFKQIIVKTTNNHKLTTHFTHRAKPALFLVSSS